MNPWLQSAWQWLAEYRDAVLLGQAGLLLVVLLVLLAQRAQLGRVRRHYLGLATGLTPGNLEQLLDQHLAELGHARREVRELEQALRDLAIRQSHCVQHVGLVRYDAFGDVGGKVSFALALLDDHRDGVLLNTVCSRDSSATYAKSVAAGESPIALTDEEREALQTALARR